MEWTNLTEGTPVTFKAGEWDGNRSEWVVVRTKDHKTMVARFYSGILDGSEFETWSDKDDFEIDNVKAWCHIPPYM